MANVSSGEIAYTPGLVARVAGFTLAAAADRKRRGQLPTTQHGVEVMAAGLQPNQLGKAAAARIARQDARAAAKLRETARLLALELSRRQGVTSWRAAVLLRLMRE